MKNLRNLGRVLATGLPMAVCTVSAQAALVGHWTFDESPIGNGGAVADSSGVTVHNGLMNTVLTNASVSGQIGGAFDFTKSGSDYMVADLETDFVTGNDAATIALWINPDSMSGQNFMFAWGNNSGGQNARISIELKNGDTVFRTRHQAGFVEFDAATVTADSGWHHVALVIPQGAPTVGDVLVYLDGALATELVNDTDALNIVAGTGSTNVFVGSNWTGATGFDGQIDDVGWWNEALSADDIKAIYDGGVLGLDLQQALIPEPGVFSLLLLGVCGLIRRRRS